jgi:hypothetical protein
VPLQLTAAFRSSQAFDIADLGVRPGTPLGLEIFSQQARSLPEPFELWRIVARCLYLN